MADSEKQFESDIEKYLISSEGCRDKRVFKVEQERKNKKNRRYDKRYHVDNRNAPAELAAL